MIWPLRYNAMLEHGKCASESSSGFCGAYAVGLDAIVASTDGFSRVVLPRPAGITEGFAGSSILDSLVLFSLHPAAIL